MMSIQNMETELTRFAKLVTSHYVGSLTTPVSKLEWIELVNLLETVAEELNSVVEDAEDASDLRNQVEELESENWSLQEIIRELENDLENAEIEAGLI